MNDDDKPKSLLISELVEMRRRASAAATLETELAQAKSLLRTSDQKYRDLERSLRPILWRCDPNGQLLECSRGWYEYTGQTPEQARAMGWFAAVHPDDKTQIVECMFDAADTGAYQAEYRLRRASDGSYRWHLAQAFPVKSPSGQITAWLGTIIDIHQRKQVEEDLKKHGIPKSEHV